MSLSLKERYRKIVYTLRHKAAYLKVEKQLLGRNTLRGYLHDIDKPLLYMALWIKLEKVQKIHRQNNRHHVRNRLPKRQADLIDTVIDWECARLTKPDKPLNAYQTLMKFYPEYQDVYLPIIKQLLPQQIPMPDTEEIKILRGISKQQNSKKTNTVLSINYSSLQQHSR